MVVNNDLYKTLNIIILQLSIGLKCLERCFSYFSFNCRQNIRLKYLEICMVIIV